MQVTLNIDPNDIQAAHSVLKQMLQQIEEASRKQELEKAKQTDHINVRYNHETKKWNVIVVGGGGKAVYHHKYRKDATLNAYNFTGKISFWKKNGEHDYSISNSKN